MNRLYFFLAVVVSLFGVVCLGQTRTDGYVLVKGGTFRHGTGGNQGALVRVEDFIGYFSQKSRFPENILA